MSVKYSVFLHFLLLLQFFSGKETLFLFVFFFPFFTVRILGRKYWGNSWNSFKYTWKSKTNDNQLMWKSLCLNVNFLDKYFTFNIYIYC